MADITSARPGLAGRDRVRADSAAGAGYRTFPARLPVVLTALGGGFVLLGSLGAAVRASAITHLREDPKTVGVLMGHETRAGWILAGLGAALIIAAFAWVRRGARDKVAAAGLLIVTGVLIASRLLAFNDRAAAWADLAKQGRPEFIGFHAGLGWGAWCMLIGAILAAFGSLIGTLRALDVRKGLGT